MSTRPSAADEDMLHRSDDEDFCLVGGQPQSPDQEDIILIDDSDIEVLSMHDAPTPERTSPGPGEAEESMSIDMDSDSEEVPLRRPHTTAKAAKPQEEDELWIYRPLEGYMKQINEVFIEEPEILSAVQETYRRLAEAIRRRPCKNPLCQGVIEMPVRPAATTSRNAMVREVLPAVDVGTMTQRSGVDRATQADKAAACSAGTQTDPTEKREKARTRNFGTSPTRPRQEKPLEVAGSSKGEEDATLPRTVADVVGWRIINGRQVLVAPPRPGCWACGHSTHRAPMCTQRGAYKYCYKCGLGNVTVKECPLHGEDWRERGPYVRRIGAYVPWSETLEGKMAARTRSRRR